MPIYMDRHDVSNDVTAESVARLHLQDLKVQHKFNCKGLTYWFDDKRKLAFCLVEAPNAEAVHSMHQKAHGQLSHSIIEVDSNLVESFLGRMEDPETLPGVLLNVINEPAFRFLLTVQIQIGQLGKDHIKNLARDIKNLSHKINMVIRDMKGTPVRQDSRNLLASFTTSENAIACGLELISRLKKNPIFGFCIGLEAGLPVEGSKSLFEDTIQTSRRLCETGSHFSISPLVLETYSMDLPESEFQLTKINSAEMVFLNSFFDYLEINFSNSELRMNAFASALNYSRSRTYRTSMNLFHCSPNVYLNRYRLKKSLDLLANSLYTVSETAFLSGFSSASYYSKCFRIKYGISPKEYMTAILS